MVSKCNFCDMLTAADCRYTLIRFPPRLQYFRPRMYVVRHTPQKEEKTDTSIDGRHTHTKWVVHKELRHTAAVW